MQTNNHKIEDYDLVLDAKYGKGGTPQRASQILLQARKEAKMSQSELAKKAGTTKSYISKIENGVIEPGVGLFFRLISSLGLRVDISKPLGI